MRRNKIPAIDDYNHFVELLNMAYYSLKEFTEEQKLLATIFMTFDRDIFEIFFRPFIYGQQHTTGSK